MNQEVNKSRSKSSPGSSPRVITTSQTSNVYQPGFFELLFNPPPTSSSKNPTLHQAQRVVAQMINDMSQRDDEIRALKSALRQSRTQAVKAEIAFLETHAVNLEKELLLTRRDLEAKRRQLEDLSMVEEEGIVEGVSFGSENSGGLGDSIADGATAALHISPHAHDEDLFGDALESHYDDSQGGFDDYGRDEDEDGDYLDGPNPASPVNQEQGYNDDTIVDQAMSSPPSHSVFGSIVDKERNSSFTPEEEEEEKKKEVTPAPMQYVELNVLYDVQANYEPNAMFCITKSQNNNCVVYKANLTASGAIHSSDPCSAYWIMFSQDSFNGRYPTEELNMIERNTAYGITCMADELERPECFTCSIASLSDRKFTVMRSKRGSFIAQTVVNGNTNCALCQVHVQMADTWIPKVQHVDIYGVDLDTGMLVHERKKA